MAAITRVLPKGNHDIIRNKDEKMSAAGVRCPLRMSPEPV